MEKIKQTQKLSCNNNKKGSIQFSNIIKKSKLNVNQNKSTTNIDPIIEEDDYNIFVDLAALCEKDESLEDPEDLVKYAVENNDSKLIKTLILMGEFIAPVTNYPNEKYEFKFNDKCMNFKNNNPSEWNILISNLDFYDILLYETVNDELKWIIYPEMARDFYDAIERENLMDLKKYMCEMK